MARLLRRSGRSIGAAGIAALILSGGMVAAAPAVAAPSLGLAALTEVDKPGTTMLSAAPFDVSAYGYEEREYFASGTASQYLNADGSVMGLSAADRMTTAGLGESAGDYTTRVVVRQPSPEVFNGTLVVEWTNVTTGQDGEFGFGESYDTLLTEGYAVAVVSAQKVGVDNLVNTRPERYGDLEVEPDCDGVACPRDAMAWDIFGQVSHALKSSPDSPFADLGVDEVIALGQSGSASYLSLYYNKIHPIHQFFDGIVFWDGAGALRSDITTPGISLRSWSFAWGAGEATGDYVREWDVAGSAHGSFFVNEYMDEVFLRDGTQPGGTDFHTWLMSQGAPCVSPDLGTKVRVGQVIGGAVAAADAWARDGVPAAPSAYFERNADGTAAHDAEGRVIGGVQIADAAAPQFGYAMNTGGWTCGAAASWSALSAQELEQRYVSHDAYVARVTEVTAAARDAGYIVASDAAKTIAEAEASEVAETDLALAVTTPQPVVAAGTAIPLSIVPELTRGAWLEVDGSPVPVTITGTATFTPESDSAASASTASGAPADARGAARATSTVWESQAQLTGLTATAVDGLTAPAEAGSLTVEWCIAGEEQPAEFAGHVNDTCSDGAARALTVAVTAAPETETPPTLPEPEQPAQPGATPDPAPTAQAAAHGALATTGGANHAGLWSLGAGLLLAGAAAAWLARRRRHAGGAADLGGAR
ncbi:alpha/beta hydrolase domain-containing protein [Leucobacter luti]|uniref:Alpha/beta hydrolase domain-containing protein n=1 Tax=Leucobacter luti TaxID=340320 RepID=A0A4Q7U082_9MICO|nr:alpha/beta hydrolase domain-containing protein [Leucobacter luti]MBL3698544.1 hypothetical protein [Leucobacter luti]RZT65918.1 hypothetical protein EV139_1341 [Leucobacter luti]